MNSIINQAVRYKPFGAGVKAMIDIGKVFSSIPKEQARSENMQNDVLSITGNWEEADVINDLRFNAVAVSDNRRGVYVLSWESSYTERRINHLNRVTGENFAIEEFRYNPNPVLEQLGSLTGRESRRFNNP